MFKLNDELHDDLQDAEFQTLAQAIEELQRRAKIPWDEAPNLAPCVSWRTCGRNYEIVEYDTSVRPWRESRRVPALRVSSESVRWVVDISVLQS
jgi:hypothetical protein